jgi:type I restriction enzyme S subunit
LGYSAKIPKDSGVSYLHNQRIGLVQFLGKNNQNIEKDFVYWLMRTEDYHSFIVGGASGTSIMHTSPSRIKEYTFLLPSLSEQKSIASILSSLDDKIELLHRQNKTLEALSETLFRQWFVEDADADKVVKLGEFTDNIKMNIKTTELSQYKHYVGLEHIPRKQLALLDWGTPENLESNKMAFHENDILFGKLRSYFHKVVFAPINGVCSTDILVLRPKKPEYFTFCLFWFYNEDVVRYSDLGAGGTRMPRTNWEILANYEIPQPDLTRIDKFDRLVKPIIDKMKYNIFQIKDIRGLRDTLLPKLMNGGVEIQDNSPRARSF